MENKRYKSEIFFTTNAIGYIWNNGRLQEILVDLERFYRILGDSKRLKGTLGDSRGHSFLFQIHKADKTQGFMRS